MSILALGRYFVGDPNIVSIVTDDDLTAITTTGYWNLPETVDSVAAIQNGTFQWSDTDLVLIHYDSTLIGFFTYDAVNFCFDALNPTGGLADTLQSGNIFVGNSSNIATGVPVTGDITMSNTGVAAIAPGVIVNADINPSAAIAFSKLAPLATGRILIGAGGIVTDVALAGDATIDETGVLTLDPTLQLGANGVASSLTLFPPTAANGFFELLPVNAGGAFNTILSNGVMGQTTTYTFPDIGASTGGVVVSTAAVRMKSVAAAAAAGGAAAQSFTDAFCTSGSVVIGNWVTQANAGEVVKIVPGNGSFVVTSTVDIGVGTFSYIILK